VDAEKSHYTEHDVFPAATKIELLCEGKPLNVHILMTECKSGGRVKLDEK
jgi:hypothetical protein